MNPSSDSGFVHSIKVPRIYKTASVIAKKVVEEGGSLKDLVYSSNHKNIKGTYALVVKTIQHNQELEKLITKCKLLEKENRLQPWLAKVLITELLFGKGELKGDSKPVQTVLTYRKQIEKLFRKKNIRTEICGDVKKPRYVRVNTLSYTPDEIIKFFRNDGWIFTPPPSDYSDFLQFISNLNEDAFTRDFHIKELLVFHGNVQFYENELYQNGHILLQDKASCLPAFLLKPKSNSVALDMCAAPGMKTTHLSAIMRNTGKIYATEMNPDRYKVLCDLVKNTGCKNVTAINTDALKLNTSAEDVDTAWCKEVEYILVDPSCSGSGIVDRVNIFENEKPDFKRLKKLCGFQYKLLLHALTSFPKAKRVVYSTCSIQTVENEKVVEDVLTKLNNLYADPKREGPEDDSSRPFRLAEPLKDTWFRRGSNDFEHGKNYIFSDPKSDLTNGFFIAVFEREKNVVCDNEDIKSECQKKSKKKKHNSLT